jgi:phospholipase C
MSDDRGDVLAEGISRRTFIKVTGAGAVAVLGGSLYATAPAAAQAQRVRKVDTPLRHVVISCSENRSFDHYFGYAPQVQAAGFGPPAGYSQPDAAGNPHFPFEFASLETPDPPHSWSAIHEQYNGGAMDGFYRSSQARIGDGDAAMGYYTAKQLPFYYSLFGDSALVANFFCSLLGPTWPNRFYMAAGTSGGITTNGVWGYGVFDYPMILDLLDAFGITWKVYNAGWDSVPYGNTDNVFVFWKKYAHDMRTRGSKGSYLNDLRRGRLPQVSFIIPSYARGWDEHPPADISVGMGLQQELITALRDSSAWDTSAYVLTYDESGGYFDHQRPPQLDAFGLGIRVPTWVISPYAKKSHLEPTLYEHTSTLKFIERVFGLPTLASVNHDFDTSTPVGSNYQAATGQVGPPAPPRDGLSAVGDLMECFDF